MRDVERMNVSKWVTLISAVYLFCLTARGSGQEFQDLQDTEEEILKKSDKVVECDKGQCKGSDCECCPGYDVKESGLWYKSYYCEIIECDKGICKGSECECCPGYAVKESGLWYKSYSCEKFIFVQWFNALANFVALTLVIVFTVVKWLLYLIYFVAYVILLIGFTVVKWIFYLLYFLTYCLYLIAYTAVKWLYSLIYNGAIILVISWIMLPIILKINYNDYLLLWYSLGKLFLNKVQERHKVHLTSTVQNPIDNYNMICSMLKKIFDLKTDEPSENPDEIALKDFMYHCPICLGSQIEILLDKGSFYTMKCGHVYCNSCIENMVGTTDVTCAVCKETCNRESFQKIFLL